MLQAAVTVNDVITDDSSRIGASDADFCGIAILQDYLTAIQIEKPICRECIVSIAYRDKQILCPAACISSFSIK